MTGKDAGFADIVRGQCKGGDTELATKDIHECLGYVSKAVGSVDEKNHSVNFVISCDAIDRYGDIVKQTAIAAA